MRHRFDIRVSSERGSALMIVMMIAILAAAGAGSLLYVRKSLTDNSFRTISHNALSANNSTAMQIVAQLLNSGVIQGVQLDPQGSLGQGVAWVTSGATCGNGTTSFTQCAALGPNQKYGFGQGQGTCTPTGQNETIVPLWSLRQPAINAPALFTAYLCEPFATPGYDPGNLGAPNTLDNLLALSPCASQAEENVTLSGAYPGPAVFDRVQVQAVATGQGSRTPSNKSNTSVTDTALLAIPPTGFQKVVPSCALFTSTPVVDPHSTYAGYSQCGALTMSINLNTPNPPVIDACRPLPTYTAGNVSVADWYPFSGSHYTLAGPPMSTSTSTAQPPPADTAPAPCPTEATTYGAGGDGTRIWGPGIPPTSCSPTKIYVAPTCTLSASPNNIVTTGTPVTYTLNIATPTDLAADNITSVKWPDGSVTALNGARTVSKTITFNTVGQYCNAYLNDPDSPGTFNRGFGCNSCVTVDPPLFCSMSANPSNVTNACSPKTTVTATIYSTIPNINPLNYVTAWDATAKEVGSGNPAVTVSLMPQAPGANVNLGASTATLSYNLPVNTKTHLTCHVASAAGSNVSPGPFTVDVNATCQYSHFDHNGVLQGGPYPANQFFGNGQDVAFDSNGNIIATVQSANIGDNDLGVCTDYVCCPVPVGQNQKHEWNLVGGCWTNTDPATAAKNVMRNGHVWACWVRGGNTCAGTPTGCFAPETRMVLGDGSTALAKSIRPGDFLWNPVRFRPVRVKDVVAGPEPTPLVDIRTDDSEVKVTTKHPMVTERGLIPARELKAGDRVLEPDLAYHTVVTIERPELDDKQIVYNFTLDTKSTDPDDHMIVGDGIATGDLYLQRKLDKERKQLP